MYDVAVVEDVWGEHLAALAQRRSVLREPEAWREPERLQTLAAGARALVVRNRTRVSRELLSAAAGLEVVARAGVGLDNVDLQAADELGIVVVAGRGANAVSVAEHALTLALTVAKRVLTLDAAVRAGQWPRQPAHELAGGTWGLLSAGATARATGRLAAALDMRVVAYDPYLPADDPDLIGAGITLTSLERVLGDADVLSIHLPATEQTHGFVDAALLRQMKPGAILVNVGRGEVLDEAALLDALDAGRLAGAGLDVRGTEPPVLGRLERQANVVLTPHVAGITEQAQGRIDQLLAADIDAVLDGGQARHAVSARRHSRRRSPA